MKLISAEEAINAANEELDAERPLEQVTGEQPAIEPAAEERG
jgi:hypothetical protein